MDNSGIERRLSDVERIAEKARWTGRLVAAIVGGVITVFTSAVTTHFTVRADTKTALQLQAALHEGEDRLDRLREKTAEAEKILLDAGGKLATLGGVEVINKALEGVQGDLRRAGGLLDEIGLLRESSRESEAQAVEAAVASQRQAAKAERTVQKIHEIELRLEKAEQEVRPDFEEHYLAANEALAVLTDRQERQVGILSSLNGLVTALDVEVGPFQDKDIGSAHVAVKSGLVIALLEASDHVDKQAHISERQGAICGYIGEQDRSPDESRPFASASVHWKTWNRRSSLMMPVSRGSRWMVDYCSADSGERPRVSVYWVEFHLAGLESVRGPSGAGH